MNLDALQHLQNTFTEVEVFVRAAVARAQAEDFAPNDALRGLVITDAEIAHLLAQGAIKTGRDIAPDEPLPTPHPDSPLMRLATVAGLNPLDVNLLLLALAPHVERRYERLYAYLQDDVSQRRPTVNLLLNLLGTSAAVRLMVWERLLPDAPLRRLLLVQPEAAQNAISFLAQPLTVDTRVVSHLLGDAAPDERIKRALMLPEMTASTDPLQHLPEALVEPMYAALHSNQMLYLQGTPGVGRADTARALCAHLGLALVVIDLEALKALDTAGTLSLAQGWRLALREATLTGAAANGSSQNGAALLLDNWESALNEATQQPPADLWDALTVYPYPVILCGKSSWESHADAQRSRRLMRFTFPMPEYPQRQRLWAAALSDNGNPAGLNTDELARKFRFTPAQIRRAVRTALDIAASRGEAQVTTDDLYAGAQAHSRLRLGHLAKQITPRHTWDDLVLPADRLTQLRELRDWAEHTYLVQETWGFGRKGAPVSGVNALFAGESGTGKTMSAEVIAADLGLVLYKIDLSAVVSKYIGETEKNLSVIFEEARASSAILFFDEADALFGKRAEVKDARDRYANIETAYLLQQVEEYDGIVILATNLRQNLDEAFTRRLDFLIDYPFPEPEYRKRIWQVHLPPQAPVAGDVDLDYLAEKYAMAGGNIRNAALASAFLAAADGKVITMQHLQHAIRREHQKMGRLVKG